MLRRVALFAGLATGLAAAAAHAQTDASAEIFATYASGVVQVEIQEAGSAAKRRRILEKWDKDVYALPR